MKKILTTTIWIILFLTLAIPFSLEYFNFHKAKQEKLVKQDILKQELKNFSFETIKEIDDIEIFKTKTWENISKKIIKKIKNAKKNIYIEVYIFTNKNIRQAVIMAKKRWVEVKIVLEKNIYKSANLNMKTFLEFKKNWILVNWSNPKNFKLNHSKMMIIDDELIISSWNFTYSTFKKNIDFFIFTKNFNLKEKFKKIFLSDFEWKKDFVYDHNIILSPNYTKEKFDILFNSAKISLQMYIPSVWDEFLEKILYLKNKKNIDLEIIFWDRKTNIENIQILKNAWIRVKVQKNIHAKAFLVDEKILYIWSVNFNKNSINQNREMWLLLKNPEIIKKFLVFFNQDFK